MKDPPTHAGSPVLKSQLFRSISGVCFGSPGCPPQVCECMFRFGVLGFGIFFSSSIHYALAVGMESGQHMQRTVLNPHVSRYPLFQARLLANTFLIRRPSDLNTVAKTSDPNSRNFAPVCNCTCRRTDTCCLFSCSSRGGKPAKLFSDESQYARKLSVSKSAFRKALFGASSRQQFSPTVGRMPD